MRIYLAGPIFYYGDYLRNIEWATKIREKFPDVSLYSPVENTDINGVEGKKKFGGSQEIANGDNIRLDNTDILIACIDGDVLPSGTCAEIGIISILLAFVLTLANVISLIVMLKILAEPQVWESNSILIKIYMLLA